MNETSEQRHVVNKTYHEIHVGDFASLTRTLMPEDVKLFAVLTGDFNPTAADARYSESGMFREVMAHGMWSGSLISTVLGTQFPGPGTILIDECLHFARPVTIGDTITVTLTAKQKFDHNKHVILDCVATNQENLQVLRGTAEVLAPSERVSHMQDFHRPSVSIDNKRERFQQKLSLVRGMEQKAAKKAVKKVKRVAKKAAAKKKVAKKKVAKKKVAKKAAPKKVARKKAAKKR